MEVANGFSELNDPREQYERFIDQMGERERGDEEAMVLDEDYIRALSYGMPPAAGIGIDCPLLSCIDSCGDHDSASKRLEVSAPNEDV